jgi:hypothetical protein
MLEKYGFYVLAAGVAVVAIGWLWLLVRAFRQRFLWGLGVLVVPPLALVFVKKHWRKALAPVLVLLLGGVVIATPYAVSFYEQHHRNLGPRERIVDGELHVTLTGWDRDDYSVLQGLPSVVVLQMANPDVDDATLEYLRGMESLRELDLNDTVVTDKGLQVLAGLPRLAELRLARTKITDEGFQKYLAAKESLTRLDLTGTPVKGKTKRDWKKAQDGREYLD